MKLNNLEELFVLELQDMFDAERQLVKALPKMAKAATSEQLRTAFQEHLEQTEKQVERLEEVFRQFGHKAKATTCDGMKGLVEEGKDLLNASGDDATRDAGLIAAAQKAEHYEIAGYGCLVTWAQQLGRGAAADLLKETLSEEKETDARLTRLAEGILNPRAAAAR
jgi:ferritin-like metal-binding protein YciE